MEEKELILKLEINEIANKQIKTAELTNKEKIWFSEKINKDRQAFGKYDQKLTQERRHNGKTYVK